MKNTIKLVELTTKLALQLGEFEGLYKQIMEGITEDTINNSALNDYDTYYDFTQSQGVDLELINGRYYVLGDYFTRTLVKDHFDTVACFEGMALPVEDYVYNLSDSIDLADYLQYVVWGGYSLKDYIETGDDVSLDQTIVGLQETIASMPECIAEMKKIVKVIDMIARI